MPCFAIEVEKNKSKNKLQGFVLGLRLPVIVIIVKGLVCVAVVKAIVSHLMNFFVEKWCNSIFLEDWRHNFCKI